ncbi:hypothetical protein [Peribacillus sp. TH24]|uniref:hypothetical protein n=1 Tax=Peribacillus sp. TH24 TaxID=2798483 RepID=UPI0019116EB7|nr:hypothetical protein [Peribacillus sp. TH24]MBK5446053.1 hypothetical protein [Peribacillus sp. TH24]
MKISGLGDLQKQLEKIQKEIENAINGEARLDEIFTDDFMKQNTKCNSIEEFFVNSPFTVKTIEDYNKLDEHELDIYTKENTDYKDWKEFSGTATNFYAKKILKEKGFDFN